MTIMNTNNTTSTTTTETQGPRSGPHRHHLRGPGRWANLSEEDLRERLTSRFPEQPHRVEKILARRLAAQESACADSRSATCAQGKAGGKGPFWKQLIGKSDEEIRQALSDRFGDDSERIERVFQKITMKRDCKANGKGCGKGAFWKQLIGKSDEEIRQALSDRFGDDSDRIERVFQKVTKKQAMNNGEKKGCGRFWKQLKGKSDGEIREALADRFGDDCDKIERVFLKITSHRGNKCWKKQLRGLSDAQVKEVIEAHFANDSAKAEAVLQRVMSKRAQRAAGNGCKPFWKQLRGKSETEMRTALTKRFGHDSAKIERIIGRMTAGDSKCQHWKTLSEADLRERLTQKFPNKPGKVERILAKRMARSKASATVTVTNSKAAAMAETEPVVQVPTAGLAAKTAKACDKQKKKAPLTEEELRTRLTAKFPKNPRKVDAIVAKRMAKQAGMTVLSPDELRAKLSARFNGDEEKINRVMARRGVAVTATPATPAAIATTAPASPTDKADVAAKKADMRAKRLAQKEARLEQQLAKVTQRQEAIKAQLAAIRSQE